jgi:alkanesulfonate monooxygenase
MLSYLAANTSKILLGTGVSPIPLRPPSILAKMVTTVDLLSGGRAVLGVGAGGAGWYKRELEAFSTWDEPRIRVDKFKEGLNLIKSLWVEDTVNFQGKYYQSKGAVIKPKPIQKPHPPIWVGSMGKSMLKITGNLADGWFAPMYPPETRPDIDMAREVIEKLDSYRLDSGRKKKITIIIGGYIEDDLERPERLADLGCDYYFLSTHTPKPSETMQKFAEEIMPCFK